MRLFKLPYNNSKTVTLYSIKNSLIYMEAKTGDEDLLCELTARRLELHESYYDGSKVFCKYDRDTDTLYVMDQVYHNVS